MCPLVDTPEQAARIVGYAKYPPQGVRGNGGLMPHLGFAMNRAQYTEAANRETLVAVQIETKLAVENVDAIAAVPGVDVLFIGPNDLHISLGYGPSYWSDAPLFRDAADKVLAAAARHGKAAGILMGNAAQARARRADGFTFIGMGADTLTLLNAVGAGYAEVTGAATPPGGWGTHLRMG
jgi:4-hydroxy-2-oxoheptanedioate aldolase